VFDAEGRFTGYRGTGKNITERKRAEQAIADSEARFQTLFEKSPVALSVTTDEDGFSSTQWNQTWLNAFGYPPEVAQGKSGNDIGLWVDPATRDYYISSAVELGGAGGIEAPMRRFDGRVRRVCVSGRFIEAGGRRLLITYYDDVTELRANERAIRELNATLESRIEERTRELSAANADLSNALEQLQQAQAELVRTEKLASLGALVAGVAHELNTPIGNCLTVASAFADRTREFERQAGSGLKRSDLADYLKTAGQAAELLEKGMHRAHDLVASFKQVAVDQSSENRRRFDLRIVVDEVAAMLHPMLRRTPWKLDIEVPPGIELDSFPGPLGQVVANFVTNAITHAFEGREQGTIRIYAKTDDGDLIFEVSDDGVGMPAEVRERAFDPFFTTRLGKGGSGLGLHIVYNIVTSVLGGHIFLYSNPGEGCRFTIRIPLTAPRRLAPSHPAS
jgi:PAS domain S-box-containing protein